MGGGLEVENGSLATNHSKRWPSGLKLTKMFLKNTWHLFQACHDPLKIAVIGKLDHGELGNKD